MKEKIKYPSLLIIMVAIVILITACSPLDTNLDTNFYNLNVKVIGDGYITDGNNILVDPQNPKNTKEISRYSSIKLYANNYSNSNSEFLFWTGHLEELYGEKNQNVYMDQNKEMLAIFGNRNEIFMTGYVSESWGNNNVYGYWKAYEDEATNLEIYAKESSGVQKAERYIYEDVEGVDGRVELFTPTRDTGEPDTANYEYLAALWKYEEDNITEFDEDVFLFVYIDFTIMKTLVLDYSPSIEDEFDRIKSIANNDDFKAEINRFIEANRTEDNMILGNTVDVIELGG